MSDMPEKIYAEPPRVTQVGWAYWYPQDNLKYIEQTSYTRTDLVDELIAAIHEKSIADAAFRRGLIAFEDYEEAKKAEVETIAKIRATPTGEAE